MTGWRALAQRWGLLHKELHADDAEEDPVWRAVLHKDADVEVGGLACNDDKLLAEMREAIMAWVKSMGRQILAGNLNLVNSSFPVLMFEPRSYLQKLADPWVYTDYVFAAAAATDPLERMKLLLTWTIAGMHKGFETWKKPFNPILGETWQASLPGGASLYMEQVSHHPPVSAYDLSGPDGSWRVVGWSQPAVAPVVKFYGIKTLAKGRRRFEMPDGTRIDFYMPHYAIKGVVYAARPRAEVLGVLRIVDAANGLEAAVAFGPVKGARHRVLARADAVCGEIYRYPGHAPGAPARTGALQRTPTEAQPLSELAGGAGGGAADADALASGSEGGGEGPDAEDEAIFDAVAAAGGLTGKVRLDADPAAAQRRSSNGGGPVGGAKSARGSSTGGGGGGGSHGGGISGLLHRHRPRRSMTASELGGLADGAANHHHAHSATDLGAGPAHGVGAGHGGASGGGGAADEPTYHRNHGVRVPGVAVARIEGSWLSHLNIDSTRYWTLGEAAAAEYGSPAPPAAGPLPSDATVRRDLLALKAGDRERSQKVKEEMEVEQRADRKLREAAGVFEHH